MVECGFANRVILVDPRGKDDRIAHYPSICRVRELFPPASALPWRVDFLVGLHPDEATDACFTFARQESIPFAVVPCCVFAELFPRAGGKVRTFEDLCAYLIDEFSADKSFLPVHGRNIVLHSWREKPH